MKPAEKHAQLCALIAKHDQLYYVENSAEISDQAYDALFAELKSLESQHPELVSPASPTQRIGEKPREHVAKAAHKTPMYSLDNTYGEGDLREFDRRAREGLGNVDKVHYVAEPKLDGASLEVVYEKGLLVLAATRGDGRIGEDVTENVRTIRSVPLRIAEQRTLTLRGEVVIWKADLAKVNLARAAEGQELFANPRNAAAGALRLMDSRAASERGLRVYFYDAVERYRDDHNATLAMLDELGLPTHRLHERCEGIDALLGYIARFDKRRSELPFETDGVVAKIDNYAERDALGFTSRFPRWAIAYKFAAERALTIVRAITSDVGRTGALTPVAELDPVPLSGTTVSRASLHNIDYVAEKDVRVGDTVEIQKAGEIIPQVISVDLSKRPEQTLPWQPPEVCPVCETKVTRGEDEAALRCPNPSCVGRLRASVWYFARRGAMDIDNMGPALIEQLLDHKLIADVADVFALHAKRDALLELPRMADKSVDNLLQSIERAKESRIFSQLLTGLGIPLLGSVGASVIAERYADLQALLDTTPEALREQLAELHGIGPKMADSVAQYIQDETQHAVLTKLIANGVRTTAPQPKAAPIEGPLSGQSFCVTGVLARPRGEVHAAIVAAGGEIHERVKKGTTYLVTGAKVGQTKITAAEKVGTKVIDEAALEEMLKG